MTNRRPTCQQELYELYLRTYCEQVSPPEMLEPADFQRSFDAWCRFSGVPLDVRGQGIAFLFSSSGPFRAESREE